MPKAVDKHPQSRGVGNSLWNPNRSGIASYADPYSAIGEDAGNAGEQIREGILDVIKFFTGVDLTEFFDWLSGIFNNLNFGNLPTPEDLWSAVVSAFLDPLSGIADAIGKAFAGTPLDLGASATKFDVWNAISGLLGIGQSAGTAAATANTIAQRLQARIEAGEIPGGGGVYFTDPFAYGTAAHLPNPPYSLAGYGPGAGTYGPAKITSGSSGSADQSVLVWKGSGSADRTELYVDQSHPLSTNNGVVSAPFVKKAAHGGYTYLIGRAGAGHIRAAVGDDVAAIQVVSSGNTFTTAASVAITSGDGDVFEFWYGKQTDPTLLWLVRNGSPIIPAFSETTHTIGSGNREWGVGGFAKGLGGIAGQAAPARLGSITVADQGN
ncbi:DUF7257 domain-containing protein [Mycolicibacterium komossense]|uniref:DUF7257 domain-containing protein n=1 Tax=Mycolicibacterium komossense TaxID=1779 RepID=A0ABT3CMS6_9MYCO|nr:hypothetical protein [Mycolicibacterium komossense]MCV7230658.1 hypothetical protein [Mycolicibacterium komossense]